MNTQIIDHKLLEAKNDEYAFEIDISLTIFALLVWLYS